MKETESASRLEGSLRAVRGSRRRPRNSHRNGSALEQFLKENASGLTFLGVTLGVFVSRKFLVLPAAVALMMAQEKLAMAGLERARRLAGR